MRKPKIFIDQDQVLANFKKAYDTDIKHTPDQIYPQSQFGFFVNLEEIPGAIKAFRELENYFDVYILTRPSIYNLNCYTEKALWILNKFDRKVLEKTIMACDKSMFKGAYLIDDSDQDGQRDFDGEWIQFGSSKFPNWNVIINYILNKECIKNNL